MKLLDQEVLHSDSLQDLELFFDSIFAHFNTVTLTSDLYPMYRDLPSTFDFYRIYVNLTGLFIHLLQTNIKA